jgi:hypothetical protein
LSKLQVISVLRDEYDRYVNEIGLTVSVAELLTQPLLLYICMVTSYAVKVYKAVSLAGNCK